MKPWEETWTTDWASDYTVTILRGDSYRVAQFNAGGPEGVARARLAAAAPDMARLLLKLEWSDVDYDAATYCPSCWASYPWKPSDLGHRDDCEWLAVMRKAGVRP